jgi:hypothetical protein
MAVEGGLGIAGVLPRLLKDALSQAGNGVFRPQKKHGRCDICHRNWILEQLISKVDSNLERPEGVVLRVKLQDPLVAERAGEPAHRRQQNA